MFMGGVVYHMIMVSVKRVIQVNASLLLQCMENVRFFGDNYLYIKALLDIERIFMKSTYRVSKRKHMSHFTLCGYVAITITAIYIIKKLCIPLIF